MTSPVANGRGSDRSRAPSPVRLKKRAEFLAVAKGRRFHAEPFSLQAAARAAPDETGARFGLTVTRKTGTAVERNRIKRRLRAALVKSPDLGRPDNDYVIVARRSVLSAPFDRLTRELARSVEKIHSSKPRSSAGRTPRIPARPSELKDQALPDDR